MGVVRRDVGTDDFHFWDLGWYVRVDQRGWAFLGEMGWVRVKDSPLPGVVTLVSAGVKVVLEGVGFSPVGLIGTGAGNFLHTRPGKALCMVRWGDFSSELR